MVYYKDKKERLSDKFNSAKDFLEEIKKAVKLYYENPNDIIGRGMVWYFSDFTEYIVDICETYLVANDRYNSRLSGVELIKTAAKYELMDDVLCDFIVKCVILRNRFTHDYYKRDGIEEDIFKCCFSEIMYMEIFLEVSDTEIHLKSIEDKK